MGEIRENVKQNLGYFLSLRGMSQKELAMKLGVSQSAVTNWIKGKNSPDIEMVALICQHLHISVAELFGMTGDETYSDRERVLVAQYRNKPGHAARGRHSAGNRGARRTLTAVSAAH